MRRRIARITASLALPRDARRAAAARIETALPDLSSTARRRLLSSFFSHRARAAAEQRELSRLDPARLCSRLELDGWERIENAERGGRGVVLLSASLGLFDLLPRVLDLYKGGADDRRHLVRLDRSRSGPTVETTFLGRPFDASTLAAETVLDQGCEALPIFAFLEPRRRFKIVVHRPIGRSARPGDEGSLTRELLASIEAEILARPEQYDWLDPRAGGA